MLAFSASTWTGSNDGLNTISPMKLTASDSWSLSNDRVNWVSSLVTDILTFPPKESSFCSTSAFESEAVPLISILFLLLN